MKCVWWIVILAIAGLCGCGSHSKLDSHSDLAIQGVWEAPESGSFIKPESGAEYPAAYPSVAVVTQSREQMQAKCVFCDNAILFILSGFGLDDRNIIDQIPQKTLLAKRIKLPVYSAGWYKFEENGEYFFVIIYPAGGNSSGNYIEVFSHSVSWYGEDLEFQCHRYDCVLESYTYWAYIGDCDEDGKTELFLSDQKDSEGNMIYTIYARNGDSFVKKGSVQEEDIQLYEHVSVLPLIGERE